MKRRGLTIGVAVLGLGAVLWFAMRQLGSAPAIDASAFRPLDGSMTRDEAVASLGVRFDEARGGWVVNDAASAKLTGLFTN